MHVSSIERQLIRDGVMPEITRLNALKSTHNDIHNMDTNTLIQLRFILESINSAYKTHSTGNLYTGHYTTIDGTRYKGNYNEKIALVKNYIKQINGLIEAKGDEY